MENSTRNNINWDIVIDSNKAHRQFWKDLWNYRELFYFISWRDILVRYKQTIIGISWSIIRPFLTMVVFTIIFGKLAKMPSDGDVPYPILVYTALLPWQFFANSLNECSNSLISNSQMVSKIYFPKLILPTSSVIVSLVDYTISFGILIAIMIWYQFVPAWTIILTPLFLLLVIMSALGIGYFIAALNVKYRDFRYIVPFFVQFGLYISPVGFSSNIIPPHWRFAYSLNPLVGAIDGFRWAILGTDVSMYFPGLALSIIITLLMFILGLKYFRKTELTFADFI
jgi:lipopolysaccharide transport system permease protein